MKILASVVSHVGNCREKNEDNFCFNNTILGDEHNANPESIEKVLQRSVLFGVFDGMGGISAGERASYIAAKSALNAIAELHPDNNIIDVMTGICKNANDIVCKEMTGATKKRMGTTASMLCFCSGRYYLCNIGDSPIFLLRGSCFKELSHEHTEREYYIKIYGENFLPENKKYKLTQHIGVFPEEMMIEPYVLSDKFFEGDKFLICSDGLTDMVQREDIIQVMKSGLSPVQITSQLCSKALENGGKDNITIIYAELKASVN